ncbi:MAG: hypothetical protein ABEI31_04935 [Halodesulfurarchaeum sp.]
MNRREFLGGLGGAGVASLAGCTAPGSVRVLDDPRIDREAGGVEMKFGKAGDWDAIVSQSYGPGPGGPGVASVHFRMSHRAKTHVDSLRLEMRDRLPARTPPVEVFMAVPDNTDFPRVDLRTTTDGDGRVISIDELGILGRGTFGLDYFLIGPEERAHLPVTFDVESRLSERRLLGDAYRLQGSVECDIPLG